MQTITTFDQLQHIPLPERKFWYISEALSSTVPIQDIGEPLRKLENLSSYLFLRSANQSQIDNSFYLRSGVLDRLFLAARIVTEQSNGELKIALTDTFRPLDLQRRYFDEIRAEISEREGLSGDDLWERVTQFIADPDGCPPHSTGGAIDCTLVRQDGAELDMGTIVDALIDKANTWHPDIGSQARQNRQILFAAMTDAGFVNLATEWWHYSYGDQYWAAYFEVPYAVYGSIDSSSAD